VWRVCKRVSPTRNLRRKSVGRTFELRFPLFVAAKPGLTDRRTAPPDLPSPPEVGEVVFVENKPSRSGTNSSV